ncbi:MAG TPA: EAL domain-containing protein, partial [Rubricoccaceae bacterium]
GLGDMLTMVNVNCSDQSFLDAGLAERARAAAEAAGIPVACLTLELTERALVSGDAASGLADAIRSAGLRLCVDDFGSGYSSLGLLHRLPVDGLKIDRSFVTDLGKSPAAGAVVRAVVQFSSDLGLRTVAEGIETPAQLRALREMGCRYGQGFLFSPPVAADVARAMLDTAPWAAQWPLG